MSKKRIIKKVAVLGSGVMGSRIACHFANIGLEVLLLDIVPFSLSKEEEAAGLTLQTKKVRNRIVNDALQATFKARPAALYDAKYGERISIGNFDDDLQKISDCDWVIEAVVENLDIKKSLFEKVEKHRKAGSLITSNTSGIPMKYMVQGRSEDFSANFCGTHFFNPPRYLRLFEVIPAPATNPEVIEFLMSYGDLYLGKETVLCKDTPAFIANRVGVYAIMAGLHTVEKMGLTVGEVDKLTGPVIGRAKSATFRTLDVVGLDTVIKVSDNLYAALPNDEAREKFLLPACVKALDEKKWYGDKTGQGFYKKDKTSGKKDILELDLKTMEYAGKAKIDFPILEAVKDVDSLKARLPQLVNSKGRAGDFYRASFYDLFTYCSYRIPEIADELYRIDKAVCAGFGWELGPFENWDVLGVRKTAEKMAEAGFTPAAWVNEMLASGAETFYKDEDGARLYYDIPSKSYKKIPGMENFIILDTIRKTKKVWGNSGTTVFDLGDGILGLEFHTKMNSIGSEVIEGINKSISLAEENFRGLVIGNEGPNFSAGANLAMLFMFAIEQEFDEIDVMIRQFQNSMMRVRYSPIPVVVAPAGMALGGGCEMCLHADSVQAHAETYMGLVEVGVGLIPAGGGTKEMTLRTSDAYFEGDPELNRLSDTFMTIATAKVSTSAREAQNIGFIRKSENITLNRSRLIADGKTRAIQLAEAGYVQPVQRKDIKVHGKAGLAMIYAGVTGMKFGNYISDHDMKIAKKIAYVMSGGDLSQPSLVSEQYLLDLEREAFLSLTGEKKTLERIQSILTKGKPLRN